MHIKNKINNHYNYLINKFGKNKYKNHKYN